MSGPLGRHGHVQPAAQAAVPVAARPVVPSPRPAPAPPAPAVRGPLVLPRRHVVAVAGLALLLALLLRNWTGAFLALVVLLGVLRAK